eukprot:gene19783-21721_t
MLVIRENTNNAEPSTDLYTLKRMFWVNGSDPELHKTIAVLYDGEGNMTQNVLLRYSFDHDEHEMVVKHMVVHVADPSTDVPCPDHADRSRKP